jgi:LPS sulfotransferase NodH
VIFLNTKSYKLSIRKYVAKENMAAARDVTCARPINIRYMICSTQRSGSTMLGDMLGATGVAGVPMEYFNDVNIEAFFARLGKNMSLEAYLRAIESCRSTANGVFGIKAHFAQIMQALRHANIANPTPFLEKFDYFITIKRRNKLAQAVSWSKAMQTGLWSSLHKKYQLQKPEIKFEPEAISQYLAGIAKGEEDWHKALEILGKPNHVSYYEDLVSDPETEILKILNFCGIKEKPSSFTPRLERQGDEQSQDFADRYIAYITDGQV